MLSYVYTNVTKMNLFIIDILNFLTALASSSKQTFSSFKAMVCDSKLWHKRIAGTYPEGKDKIL